MSDSGTISDKIVLYDTCDWLVIIPTDKKTLQNLAADTKWRSYTKRNNNLFDKYVSENLNILIYVYSKTSNAKYAIIFETDGKIIDLQNKTNDEISSLEFKSETGYDPAFLVAQARNSPEWEKFIKSLDTPYQLSKKLADCADNGDLDGVKLLIELGANIHADSDAALKWASFNDHLELIRLLIDHGANIHTENEWPLRYASYFGNMEIAQLLLDRGANVHATNELALRLACSIGHVDIVALLLEYGANINACGCNNMQSAIDSGQTEMVRVLLNHGCKFGGM